MIIGHGGQVKMPIVKAIIAFMQLNAPDVASIMLAKHRDMWGEECMNTVHQSWKKILNFQ